MNNPSSEGLVDFAGGAQRSIGLDPARDLEFIESVPKMVTTQGLGQTHKSVSFFR
jgi:hypothetical protein